MQMLRYEALKPYVKLTSVNRVRMRQLLPKLMHRLDHNTHFHMIANCSLQARLIKPAKKAIPYIDLVTRPKPQSSQPSQSRHSSSSDESEPDPDVAGSTASGNKHSLSPGGSPTRKRTRISADGSQSKASAEEFS